MLRLSKEEVNPGPRHSRPSTLPAPVPRHSKSPSFCSPLSFLSPLSHSHVSLYVIPAKAGIQSLSPCATRWCWGFGRPGVLGHSSGFPLKTAGMTGGEPAGKTGGKRRERQGGNGGKDCMSFPRKRESRVFSPSATRWCWGLGRPGVLGHSSGFPLKTEGMTGG